MKPGRALEENHELARLAGEPRYEAVNVHTKCGTFMRYTRGGACVHCATVLQREYRAAKKKLDKLVATTVEAEDKAADEGGYLGDLL